MAHKLMLTQPYDKMPYLWNVTSSVGTTTKEMNRPTDVRLAKLLVSLLFDVGSKGAMWPTCQVKPVINEVMDQGLGYWIYYNQVEARCPADGAISPCPKVASSRYFIARMNHFLFLLNNKVWATLPDHPLCGPMLRQELLAPAR